MPDNNGTVLEKYNFVHGKSLKSPWISFLEKCGNHLYMLWWSSKKAKGWGWHPSNVNTLRPRQNGRHFPDDILKCIFLNENVWISIKISQKFDPKGPINNSPALIQIMAWRRPGDKPLSETMLASLMTHICVTQPQWVNRSHLWLSFEVLLETVGNVCDNLSVI